MANIQGKIIDRSQLWIGVRQILWRSIAYSLSATIFTEAQCIDLLCPIKTLVVPKLGMNSKFLHAFLFSPIEYGGRNFPNIYWE